MATRAASYATVDYYYYKFPRRTCDILTNFTGNEREEVGRDDMMYRGSAPRDATFPLARSTKIHDANAGKHRIICSAVPGAHTLSLSVYRMSRD